MSDVSKCFVGTQDNGYRECLIELVDGYDSGVVLPRILWPDSLDSDCKLVELLDAQGKFHMVKMHKFYDDEEDDHFICSFCGDEWVDFISTVKHLGPKFFHLEQSDLKSYRVNFYTKDGDEIHYRVAKRHVSKCVVVGCHDPRMYQPIPHEMLLSWHDVRNSKRVSINFNDVISPIRVTWSVVSRLKKFVGVAFTGPEWEAVCEREMFCSSKVIVISSDEYGTSFAGKVLDGFVSDTDTVVKKLCSSPGESSKSVAVSGGFFIAEFGSCATNKGYLSIPASFHGHKISGKVRPVWLKAGGRSLYMCAKVHVDRRVKSEKKKNVLLVGEMDRLKDALELEYGDMMRFVLVSGSLSSDEALFFDVFKFV